MKKETKILGNIVTSEKIRPDPEKIKQLQIIKNQKISKNLDHS